MSKEIRDINHAANVVACAMANCPDRPVGVNLAPGNGTLYRLVFVKLGEQVGDELGAHSGRVLVALVNFGSCFHFSMTKTSATYIQEKLSLAHIADAQVIADLIEAIGEYEPHALTSPVFTD